DATSAAVVGSGVNGLAVARSFAAVGRGIMVYDVDSTRAKAAAVEVGAGVAGSLEEALAADVVVTVTPGREVLIGPGVLRPGQHVSLMGADGPGKSENAPSELARGRCVRDDLE